MLHFQLAGDCCVSNFLPNIVTVHVLRRGRRNNCEYLMLCHQFPRLNDSNVSLIMSICRLSKENSNDAQPSSIDWLELIEAVNKIQKQSCKYMSDCISNFRTFFYDNFTGGCN